jgi:hypothetical protein
MILMRRKLSDRVRDAVDACGRSRYAVCKAIGLNQGTLSRFMKGGGLSLDSLDRLAEFLRLDVEVKIPRRKGD